MSEVTRILSAIEEGDARAADQLLPLVYEELRSLAARKMSHENPGHTPQATALVHEAYMRLVGNDSGRAYRDRSHFFASAGTAMRRILVDAARAKETEKRGGGRRREPLEDVVAPVVDGEVLALDEALEKLASEDPLKAQLVELRYFVGLTGDQAAEVLGISPSAATWFDMSWPIWNSKFMPLTTSLSIVARWRFARSPKSPVASVSRPIKSAIAITA